MTSDGKIEIAEIIRTSRRSLALVVTKDASLIVRAPLRMPFEQIEKFVHQKNNWIQRTLARVARRPKPLVKEFVAGESFLYLGQTYPLRIVDGLEVPVLFDGELKLSRNVLSEVRECLIDWYKQEAREVLEARAMFFAEMSDLTFQSLRITNARTRWGSCGPKRSLNFNWRIVMAPLEVIDYLVVHELMHLKERNHSARFWLAVQALLPGYRTSKKWLKENERILSF